MSRMGIRFLMYFGILVGMALGFIGLFVIGQWLMPSTFGPLPVWLPEDSVAGFGYFFLDTLLLWIPALVLSAVVITFSFGLKPDDIPSNAIAALVRFSLLAIVSTSLFAILTLLGQPWVDSRLADLEFRRVQTRQLEEAYLTIKERGSDQQTAASLDARLHLLKRLGTLRPLQGQMGGKEILDYDFELQIIRAHMELDEFFKLRALPGVGSAADAAATVEQLLEEAERALANPAADQEYTANLAAFQAYRRLMNAADQGKPIDTRSLDRARGLIDASWARIYEKTLAADERLKASYFFRKGKSLGDFQFQNYLESYYGFQELHIENPRDSEVTQHWELSREKVAGQVLFLQDMDVLFAVPGTENLVFLNKDSPLEMVRIGKLLNTSQGVFVKDFEFLRTDRQGKVLLQWTADYGRWTDQGIDFRVWDRERPEPHYPVVLTETAGDEFNPEGTVDPPRFQPRVAVRDLELVSSRTPQPQTLGTMELRIHGESIEALGYNSRLFQTEFLVRLATPFGFFVTFLFTFALAWRNRAQQQSRSWWFLVPLLPLVIEFVVQSTDWAARLMVGGLVHFTGLETSGVVLAGAFLAASVVGVVLAARAFRR